MRLSRSDVVRKAFALPELRFEDQSLTSFSGLVLLQALVSRLDLRERLRSCFRHLPTSPVVGYPTVVLALVCHITLGFRFLRDLRYYRDDPLVKRFLGLERLPDVATICRALQTADDHAVAKLRVLIRSLVSDRLRALWLSRVTLDFDGSVQSTRRSAQGTAVGFNKKRKGERSYYPLFCTIAQLGEVFDVFHRSGNVHDSNGARVFILECLAAVRQALPHAILEVRMDSAFFSDEIVSALDELGIEFTISVPFERFSELKGLIESRKRWRRFGRDLAFFETAWKPKVWDSRYRFVFVRRRVAARDKGPLQLDLFTPRESGYEFKVIVTNKTVPMKKVLAFHNGRGAQEGIFAELKSQAQMDYIPVRGRVGNQIWLLSGILAHNLSREMQMIADEPARSTTEKRSPLWMFQGIQTLRRNLLQRAGRITHPSGRFTLTMAANRAVAGEIMHFLGALTKAA